MESLAELRARRAFECRLVPARALRSLDEAAAFLRDRRLLTRTTDCALPSLYEACHEDPYRPGLPGFATWPAGKWPWFGELAGRGYLITGVHRGKNLLVGGDAAALLDPICRAEIERMSAVPEWSLVLDHLADAGPSEVEDLKVELGLKPKELKAILYPLELCGAVVRRPDGLARWDQVFPEPPAQAGGIEELLVAAVRAAVVAPEKEVGRWFSWRWLFRPELVDRLVSERRLERPEPGWLTVAFLG